MSMAEYQRDYGTLKGAVAPTAPLFSSTKRTQVYQATHKNENYLPFMNRSFISFSYGGQNIEDFNLVATIENNRLNKNGYADFEDLVTNYNILDGQLYWGTHYTKNSLSFKLATDGMTQQELDNFLLWFAPGKNKELILAEHPNRAILARVSSPPTLALLPFEEKVETYIGGYTYNTSTTLYKGEITLEFIMDNPFWYSKINIFGYGDSRGVYHDVWTDANGDTVSIYKDPDAIKIALEDNIPISSMLAVSLLLGDNTFANMDDEQNGIIAMGKATLTLTRDSSSESVTLAVYNTDEDKDEGETTLYNTTGNHITDSYKWRAIAFTRGTSFAIDPTDSADTMYHKLYDLSLDQAPDEPYVVTRTNVADVNPRSQIAEVSELSGDYVTGARIAGPIMNSTTGIETMARYSNSYFYYAGTAPSFPILKFTMDVNMSNNYINIPQNSYTSSELPYNTITIESVNKSEFKFTTPNIYTSYNQVIEIFGTMRNGNLWESIREKIRANVNHSHVRRWAMRVIDSLDTGTGLISASANEAKARMSFMFKDKSEYNSFLPATFIFDSKTGEATGKITCRTISTTNVQNSREWWQTTAGNIEELTENVGDMVRSNFLVIRDRNYPDDKGYIRARENNNPNTYKYCHILYHDVYQGLRNVFIQYQNMYL